MIKHTPYIIQYDDVLKSELIDEYLNTLSSFFEGRELDLSKTKQRYNEAFSLGKYKNESAISEINSRLCQLSYFCMIKYFKDCPLIGHYLNPHKNIGTNMIYRTYNKYDSYNWHIDHSEQARFLVSVILYLNDDYEGGKTLFLNDKLKINPKRGSVLVFPCGPYFLHKSTPIRSGKKHIIWNCFQDKPHTINDK
jgi:hypothetical protein